MRNSSIFFAVAFFCALFTACNGKKEDNNSQPMMKTTKWEDGTMQSEQYFVNDSIKEGHFKKYYRSGKLEIEANYHENKIEGELIGYYENGNKKGVMKYFNGIPTGEAIDYFEDGKVADKMYYHEGKAVGEVYYYHPNGKLKAYQGNNFKGEPKFAVEYSEGGGITAIKGNGVLDISPNETEFEVGDTLKVLFLVATPDKSEVQFQIYDDLGDTKNSKDLMVDHKDSAVRYEKVFEKKGTIKWGGFYSIKFENGKEEKYPFGGISVVR